MPIVISFANMKGGVGKTTLCVNLAFELFSRGKKVLVVDNDPQFNATSSLLNPKVYIEKCIKKNTLLTTYNIYEKTPNVGRKRKRIIPSKFIENIWYQSHDDSITLDLIPSRIELYETLRNPSHKEYLVDKFIRNYAGEYNYVFIDCPPTPSVLTLSAFAASDFVIIPVKPDFFSTLGIPQFINTLEDFKDRQIDQHDVQPLGIVFTDVDRRLPRETKQSMTRVKRTIEELSEDLLVFDSRLSHLEVFKKTLWQAVPVQQITGRGTKGKTLAMLELKAIAKEILTEIDERIKND